MQQKLLGSLPEPLLVANVYRPMNYGDMDSLLYVGLHAIIIYTNCMHSRYYCRRVRLQLPGLTFFKFYNFGSENKLAMSETSRLSSAVSYVIY